MAVVVAVATLAPEAAQEPERVPVAPVVVPAAETVVVPEAVPAAEMVVVPEAVPVAEMAAPGVVPEAVPAAPEAEMAVPEAAPVGVPEAETVVVPEAAPVVVPEAETVAVPAAPAAEMAAPAAEMAAPVAEMAAPATEEIAPERRRMRRGIGTYSPRPIVDAAGSEAESGGLPVAGTTGTGSVLCGALALPFVPAAARTRKHARH
jgi:light-harvesting protein B-800-850 alpha chain